MAPEEDGELTPATETPSSLDLFEREGAARGWRVERAGRGLRIDCGDGRPRLFPWPPAPPVRKSAIRHLLDGAVRLRAVPTQPCSPAAPDQLPICVKLDVGSLGVGFRVIRSAADWRDFLASGAALSDFIVQPLLRGPEHRVTLCANGTFAAAHLAERRGDRSRWIDSTPSVPTGWLEDLHRVMITLAAPVVGVDILVADDGGYLLDVNLAPDLAVHLVTDPPRALAPAALDSWLAMSATNQ